jgi:hypothetical protein
LRARKRKLSYGVIAKELGISRQLAIYYGTDYVDKRRKRLSIMKGVKKGLTKPTLYMSYPHV